MQEKQDYFRHCVTHLCHEDKKKYAKLYNTDFAINIIRKQLDALQ